MSLASLAVPDFFLDSLPANCGTLVPFRLCSCSQPQSSPWDLTSESRASAPSPHPSQWVSRQASRAGECWPPPIICAGISPFCPPHCCCCTLLHASEASPPTTHSLRPRRVFLVCGNLSSFTAGAGLVPILLSLFFLLPYPCTWGVSCLLGGLRSSVSVQ